MHTSAPDQTMLHTCTELESWSGMNSIIVTSTRPTKTTACPSDVWSNGLKSRGGPWYRHCIMHAPTPVSNKLPLTCLLLLAESQWNHHWQNSQYHFYNTNVRLSIGLHLAFAYSIFSSSRLDSVVITNKCKKKLNSLKQCLTATRPTSHN